MHIVVDSKTIVQELEKVKLRGKYFSSSGAKTEQISDAVKVVVEGEDLFLYNGNPICMCFIKIGGITVIEEGEFDAQISTMLSHLKVFNGSINIEVDDKIVISNERTGKSALPLLLNHPHPAIIARLRTFDKDTMVWNGDDETSYVIGKTNLPTTMNIFPTQFKRPVKGCDNINMGRYKFDFTISTSFSNLHIETANGPTNYFQADIDPSEACGDDATVEFNGPFLTFFDEDIMTIRMGDDVPILFASEDRALIKAPFIEG